MNAASQRQTPQIQAPQTQTQKQAIDAIAALLGDARLVGYRPCFARAFGGAACAVLLSQFWFWTQTPSGQSPERGGWFWKSQTDITEETGLSRRETETARRRLRDLGVLFEDVRGIPGTLHYRLDVDALMRRLQPLLEAPAPAPAPTFARNGQTCARDSARLPCADAPNLPARTRHSNSEKPPEISQKNIRSLARPVLPAAWEKKPPRPNSGEPDRKGEPERKRTLADVRLPELQCQVNRQGTARLKDAIHQAMREAARRGEPP